jgi:hypothetical protein
MGPTTGGTVVAEAFVTMRLHSMLLSSFVLVSLSATACSIKLGDKTEGEKGAMTFAYDGRGCLFGCGLDRSALQGAQITVNASGGNASVRPTARIAAATVARVSKQTESCSCDSKTGSTSNSRSVEPSETCASGETKSCTLSVDIEAAGAGDAELEVVDPKGGLIDRVTIHVRPAARLDITVDGLAVKDGEPTTVRSGEAVKLETHAFDADGSEELFTKHGISHDYGDTAVIAPDPAVIIGSTDIEDMIAVSPGDTTVKVYAPGAARVVQIHVTK